MISIHPGEERRSYALFLLILFYLCSSFLVLLQVSKQFYSFLYLYCVFLENLHKYVIYFYIIGKGLNLRHY